MDTEARRWEGTGKTWNHGANEKGRPERDGSQCVESCPEVKGDEDGKVSGGFNLRALKLFRPQAREFSSRNTSS